MNNYFVIGNKKYVRTREFVEFTKGKWHERIDIYDVRNDRKITSMLYTEKQIQDLLSSGSNSKK